MSHTIPPEYKPWLTALMPFITDSLKGLNRASLNRDENDQARILLALYILGVVQFIKQKNSLTYGQERFLSIKVLEHSGWPYDAAAAIYDVSLNLCKWLPAIADDAEDAMNAGLRAAKAYFEDSDMRALMMPGFKLLQWKEKGLYMP